MDAYFMCNFILPCGKMWLKNSKCQGKLSFMWIKSHILSCFITVPMTTVDPSEAGFGNRDHCVFSTSNDSSWKYADGLGSCQVGSEVYPYLYWCRCLIWMTHCFTPEPEKERREYKMFVLQGNLFFSSEKSWAHNAWLS